MIKKKGLKYGFDLKKEYDEYKELLKKKNISITYTNWYEKKEENTNAMM